MRNRRLVALLAALAFAGPAQARRAAPQPSPEEVRTMAARFSETLASRRVTTPDDTLALVVAPAAEEQSAEAILTRERLLDAFETISEAEAWPATWLVVQDRSRSYDLLLAVERAEDGTVSEPAALFTAPRREWGSAEEVERALKEIRGERLDRRVRNVVTVEYSVKTVTTYVYQLPQSGAGQAGLLAMVRGGGLLREARPVDLGDGQIHTLALVLQQATFVPSDCVSCEGRLFGHADSGKVLLVLAGEKALEDTLDLTAHLFGTEGKPLVPRFRCEEADEDPAAADQPVAERFRDRESMPLLALQDHDGDGAALEASLPARFLSCGETARVVVGVDRETRKLKVVGEVEEKR